MFKLRQTWNEVFPVRILYEIDVSVKKIDPAWPISAVLSGNTSITNAAPSVLGNRSTSTNENKLVGPTAKPQTVAANPAATPFLSSQSNKIISSVNSQEVKNDYYFSIFSVSSSTSRSFSVFQHLPLIVL